MANVSTIAQILKAGLEIVRDAYKEADPRITGGMLQSTMSSQPAGAAQRHPGGQQPLSGQQPRGGQSYNAQSASGGQPDTGGQRSRGEMSVHDAEAAREFVDAGVRRLKAQQMKRAKNPRVNVGGKTQNAASASVSASASDSDAYFDAYSTSFSVSDSASSSVYARGRIHGLDSGTARDAIILSEIIGPPVSKRAHAVQKKFVDNAGHK